MGLAILFFKMPQHMRPIDFLTSLRTRVTASSSNLFAACTDSTRRGRLLVRRDASQIAKKCDGAVDSGGVMSGGQPVGILAGPRDAVVSPDVWRLPLEKID